MHIKEESQVAASDLNFLHLAAWIRRQTALLHLYRLLPKSLRARVSGFLGQRASAGARFQRTPAWQQAAATRMPLRCTDTSITGVGVNLVGYLRGQFGLGESARMYARALIEAGVEVTLYDVDLDLPHGWQDQSLEEWLGTDLPHRTTILFVNPDYLEPALDKIGRERLAGQHLIGCWFWELERVPDEWLPAIGQVDEIMVATEYVERAFRRATDKPVMRVPLPLDGIIDSGLERRDFGLEEDAFVFLVSLDFNSWFERKNPLASVRAFLLAFPEAVTRVRLLIKTSNGFRYPEKFHALLLAAGQDSRIIVRDDVIDRGHMGALQRCCDAYVSLHRAEGFGLGLAEAMFLGKPVIGTAWSGNVDFMDDSNSCLVDFNLIPVLEGQYSSSGGQHWADADIASAASCMRRIATDPEFARSMGQRAARDIRRSNSPAAAAKIVIDRLRALQHTSNAASGDMK